MPTPMWPAPTARRFPVRPSAGVGSDWYLGDAVSGEALTAEMDDAGVGRAVVVQGIGAYGHECSCAASTVCLHPDRFALVVSVDMDGPDPVRRPRGPRRCVGCGSRTGRLGCRVGRTGPPGRGAPVRRGCGDDRLAARCTGGGVVADGRRPRAHRRAVRVRACARCGGRGGGVASRGAGRRRSLRLPRHGRRRGVAGGAAAGRRPERGAQGVEPRAGGRRTRRRRPGDRGRPTRSRPSAPIGCAGAPTIPRIRRSTTPANSPSPVTPPVISTPPSPRRSSGPTPSGGGSGCDPLHSGSDPGQAVGTSTWRCP